MKRDDYRRGAVGLLLASVLGGALSGCGHNYPELAQTYAEKKETHKLKEMIEEGEPPARTAAAKWLVKADPQLAQSLVIGQYRAKNVTAADVTEAFLGAEDFGFSVLLPLASDDSLPQSDRLLFLDNVCFQRAEHLARITPLLQAGKFGGVF